MIKARTAAACLVATGLMIAFIPWLLGLALEDRENLYLGKRLDVWRRDISEGRQGAHATVSDVVIPALTHTALTDTNDSPARIWLVESLNNLPGIHVHFTPADGRRIQAVEDIGSFGTNASPAVPILLDMLKRKDPWLTAPACSALVQIHADPDVIVPAMTNCLVDAEGRGQSAVVDALGELGEAAKQAVPHIVELLKDRSSKDIMRAVPKALKKIDPEAAAKAGVR